MRMRQSSLILHHSVTGDKVLPESLQKPLAIDIVTIAPYCEAVNVMATVCHAAKLFILFCSANI